MFRAIQAESDRVLGDMFCRNPENDSVDRLIKMSVYVLRSLYVCNFNNIIFLHIIQESAIRFCKTVTVYSHYYDYSRGHQIGGRAGAAIELACRSWSLQACSPV